jgi:hypothetical protein
MKKIIVAFLGFFFFFIGCEKEKILIDESTEISSTGSRLKSSRTDPKFNGWDEINSTPGGNSNLYQLFQSNLDNDVWDEDLGFAFNDPNPLAADLIGIDTNNTPTDLIDDNIYYYYPFENVHYDGADMDGDTKGDIIITTDNTSYVYINYGSNGYSATQQQFWDWYGSGYGNEIDNDFDFADMDGLGKADIVKVGKNGDFRIDFAENGLGSWDVTYMGYGDATKNTFICADLNGGGKADLFKVGQDGKAWIDFAENGFGSWDWNHSGYGDERTNYFCLEDFDNDGKVDIAKLDGSGYLKIDYAYNGFGSWDFSKSGYGPSSTRKKCFGDYDGDGMADILTLDDNYIRIDYSSR